MQIVKVDPLLRKVAFAQARGWSTRTVDRYVARGMIPPGEIMDAHGTRGWRASLVNMTLQQLEELAKSLADDGAAAAREVIADKMRGLGAKGGRRRRGRPPKAPTGTGAPGAA